MMNKYYKIAKNWKNISENDLNDFKNFICYANDYLKEERSNLQIFCKYIYDQKYVDIYIKILDKKNLHFKIDKNDKISCAAYDDTIYEHLCDNYCYIFRT